MIKLCCWLVIPRAPRLSTVDGYKRALIANQQHNVRIIGIDPHVLIVVAARSSAKTRPRFSTVHRLHGYCARAIDDVWIFRVNSWHRQVASADAPSGPGIGGDALPVFTCIIGTINPNIGALTTFATRTGHRGEEPAGLARRNREIHLDDALGQPIRQRFPGLPSVRRFKKSSTRPVVLISVFPRTEPQLPKPRINYIWIRGIDLHVRAANVFTFGKHPLPILPAVRRQINSALFIRSIRMTKRRCKNAVRVARIDGERRNSLTIAKTEMRPRFAPIAGFVNSVTNGEIGPRQPFTARNINDVGVRRSHGDGADGL